MLSRRTESSRILLFLADQLLLGAAFAVALGLKQLLVQAGIGTAAGGFPGGALLQPGDLVRQYLVAAPILAVALSAAGLYRASLESPWTSTGGAREVLLGGLVAMLALGVVSAALRPVAPAGGPPTIDPARGVIWLFLPCAWLALGASRALCAAAGRRLAEDGTQNSRVLVFGLSQRIEALLATLRHAPQMRLHVLGVVSDNPSGGLGPPLLHGEALALLRQGQVDHVLIESEQLSPETLHELLSLADREGVSVHLTSALFPVTNLVPTWERIGGVALLGFVAAELPLGAHMAKRGFDLTVATLMLAALAPVMALAACAVRLSSPGPVLYVQRRVGAGGRAFRMYKFRSMRIDAEAASGPVFAVANDPRCTAVGRWLRRTNFDELPQLFNVLAGDMSLVGPRPERPEFLEELKRSIPRYAHKHWVRPGLTGWAQVHGLRGAGTSLHARIEHDLYYIRNWSLMLDLRILVRTLFHGYLNAA